MVFISVFEIVGEALGRVYAWGFGGFVGEMMDGEEMRMVSACSCVFVWALGL